MVIDIFSKYGWIVPLKNKTGIEVTKAFESILNKGRKPNKIWSDSGKEFYNKSFKQLLDKNNIILYSTQNEEKSTVVERWIKTMKNKIYKNFTLTNSNKYYNVLDNLLNEYNNSHHSTINMTPIEGSKKSNEEEIYNKVFKEEHSPTESKFNIGDSVRIVKYKNKFEKGYTTNWTKEIFKIVTILPTIPTTYKIKDLKGEEVLGSFYQEELQLSKF